MGGEREPLSSGTQRRRPFTSGMEAQWEGAKTLKRLRHQYPDVRALLAERRLLRAAALKGLRRKHSQHRARQVKAPLW